jgi:hypothetical protein
MTEQLYMCGRCKRMFPLSMYPMKRNGDRRSLCVKCKPVIKQDYSQEQYDNWDNVSCFNCVHIDTCRIVVMAKGPVRCQPEVSPWEYAIMGIELLPEAIAQSYVAPVMAARMEIFGNTLSPAA